MSKVEGIMSRKESFEFLHDEESHRRQNTEGSSSFEGLLNLCHNLYQI